MIDIIHVTYTYPGSETPALQDISLHIPAGKTVLLAGKSGSGKSSILRLINGLLLQDREGKCRGNIRIGNEDIRKIPMWKLAETVGTIFQNPRSQFFNIDTTDEILFGLESRGASHREMEETLKRVTEELGIRHLLDRNIFGLSGGEKQRIAFASIYAMDPDIYVMDEPSSNLDEEGILNLRENLCRVRNQGKTIVIAEHRLWYFSDFVDDVYLVDQGKILRHLTDAFRNLRESERKAFGLREIRHCLDRGTVPADQKQESVSERKSQEVAVPGDGLTVRRLSAFWKRRKVWQNLSFHAGKGEITAVTGRNGAGKSTLSRILTGLKKPESGEILWDGRRMKRKDLRRISFLVMQDVNAQLFAESVMAEVMLDLEDTEENRKKAETCLRENELLTFRERHPMCLSGGQKQRLAVADAMAEDRKMVIFDEPTSGLDYEHMVAFAGMIRHMAEQGCVILVITHDTELIRECGAREIRLA